jgi:hypothetical protein
MNYKPIDGHLGNREPIVKPTSREVGFLIYEQEERFAAR